MSSNNKLVQGTRNIIKDIVFWAINTSLIRWQQAILVPFSAGIAKHFGKRDAEFATFKAEVIQVATDHHSRLRKLEGVQ